VFIKKVCELDLNDSDRDRTIRSIINTGIVVDYYNYLVREKINRIATKVKEKKFQVLSTIIDEQERFANINTQQLQQNTDNFVRFVDRANSIDVEKIKTVRDLFKEMTGFSKSIRGDLGKLADILSEKLVDVLEKLNDTIKEINNIENQSGMDEVIVTDPSKPNSPFNKIMKQSMENQTPKTSPQRDYNKKLGEIEGDLDDMIALLRQIKENTER
jgi:hypothetical protein